MRAWHFLLAIGSKLKLPSDIQLPLALATLSQHSLILDTFTKGNFFSTTHNVLYIFGLAKENQDPASLGLMPRIQCVT